MIIIKCAVCGKDIENPTMRQLTCGGNCSKKYENNWRTLQTMENERKNGRNQMYNSPETIYPNCETEGIVGNLPCRQRVHP